MILKNCEDVPEAVVDIELLDGLNNDVVVLYLGSKLKFMVSKSRCFTPQELETFKNYELEKIKTLDIGSSVENKLVVVDIVGDLRLLLNSLN